MPRGDKSAYTDKQKRQAIHIEESELERGQSLQDAERIAWATINKHDGGGKLSGSGRKHAGKTAAKKTVAKKPVAKRAVAKKAVVKKTVTKKPKA